MKEIYTIEQGFVTLEVPGSNVISPVPARYILEKEGDELTFLIRRNIHRTAEVLMYYGLSEDENYMIFYIGLPSENFGTWLIERFREIYQVIPDVITLRKLFEQIGLHANI